MRRAPRWLVCALLAALGFGSSSCSEWAWIGAGAAAVAIVPNSRLDRLYNKQYQPAGLRPVDGADGPLIGYVEFDDFGWYRQREQGRALLDTLQHLTAKENVIVVLYMHGWRHHVSDGDPDMKSFKETLRFLNAQLDSDTFRTVRSFISGRPSARVIGVAVGWRGQSWWEVGRALPAWFIPKFALDAPVYFTAFGRKQTANVVGGQDLQDFVGSLADLHTTRWEQMKKADGTGPLMSLVMVGHSFGGHALFDATRERLERNLERAIVGNHIEKESGLAVRAVPRALHLDYRKDEPAPTRVACLREVDGIGDLVVLINPAIEAASYRNVNALVKSATFPPRQTPVLLTISSTNDGARLRIFRGLRWFTEFGRTWKRSQYSMQVTALGTYSEHHTNWLDLASKEPELRKRASVRVSAAAARPATDSAIDPEVLREALQRLDDTDLSRTFGYGNVTMTALENAVPHSPALVVNTSSQVVNGHSDFFRQEFIHWLSRYVLEIQVKRLLRLERMREVLRGAQRLPAAVNEQKK